jgi:hypothetical protein
MMMYQLQWTSAIADGKKSAGWLFDDDNESVAADISDGW